MQISGPDVADLSFCDLPGSSFLLPSALVNNFSSYFSLGLIASVRGGRAVDNIDLVRDLVGSYIEKPSCVILVAVACESKLLLVSFPEVP